MGRPPVESEEIRSRVQQPLLGELDAWAKNHNVTRAEAIRRLIAAGLEAESEDKIDSTRER